MRLDLSYYYQKQYIKCLKSVESEEWSRQRGVKSKIKLDSATVDQSWKSVKKNLSLEGCQEKTQITLGPLAISQVENNLRMRPKLINGEVKSNLYNLKMPILSHTG